MRLIENLKQSGLIAPEELVAALSASSTPEGILHDLQSRGLITAWQSRSLLAGQKQFFIGKYKLLSQVAKGGTGVVFRAVETRGMQRDVAIKVLSPEHVQDPEHISRVYREIEIAASLLHRNIVTVIEAGQLDVTPYLVMEFERGRTLLEWTQRFGSLPVGWACECTRQVAVALEFLDDRGILHRDIKPSNILVRDEQAASSPHVKVLDLGLARLRQVQTKLTKTGLVVGTLGYIAPERVQGDAGIDIRADLFSLGCTLFEMLTGRLPWLETNIDLSIQMRMTAPPPSIVVLRPEVPIEVDDLVSRLLAPNPDERYQTPRDVIRALQPFCQPAGSQPDPMFEKLAAQPPRATSQTSLVAAASRAANGETLPKTRPIVPRGQ